MSQDMLERELARRADDVHGAPLSFADVRGKAVSIRRRRRASVAGAVAAVVALVVIVPTALGGGDRPGSDDVDPAPPRPVTGAILEDGLITLPGGEELPVDLAAADAQTWVVLDDGQVVVARNNPTRVDVYSPDGERRDYPVMYTHVVGSATGDAAAWIEEDGTVRVLASGAAEPVALGQVEVDPDLGAMVDVVLGPDRVLVGDGTATIDVTADGAVPLETSRPLQVEDASPQGILWAVSYADDADPQFGCAGLYDPASGALVAESCDTASLRFSPDGQHLTGALGDNGSWGSVEVFDTELREVLSFDPPGRQVVTDWAWVDAETLRVVVVDTSGDPQWSVVLVPIDGGPTTVETGPTPGEFPEAGLPPTFSLSD